MIGEKETRKISISQLDEISMVVKTKLVTILSSLCSWKFEREQWNLRYPDFLPNQGMLTSSSVKHLGSVQNVFKKIVIL